MLGIFFPHGDRSERKTPEDSPQKGRPSPARRRERQPHNGRKDHSKNDSRQGRHPEHDKPDRKNGTEAETHKKRTEPTKGNPRQAATRATETTRQRSLTRQPETPATPDTKDTQPKHGQTLQRRGPGHKRRTQPRARGTHQASGPRTRSQGRRVFAAPRLALYAGTSEARAARYTDEPRAAQKQETAKADRAGPARAALLHPTLLGLSRRLVSETVGTGQTRKRADRPLHAPRATDGPAARAQSSEITMSSAQQGAVSLPNKTAPGAGTHSFGGALGGAATPFSRSPRRSAL